MRQRLGSLILFLGMLMLSVPAHSQTATDAPPSVTLQASSRYCGQATIPLYCFGIPLTAPDGSSGTAWLDIYPNNTGFIALNTTSLHTTVYITGATRVTNQIGQTTSITITFIGVADPDNDGDSDNLTGSATFYFNYVYQRTARFYLLYVTSGSVTYSIAI